MSWETVPLNSVSEVIRGVTFAKADSSSTQIENSLPVLRAGNIQEQIILDDGLVYVSEDKIKDAQLLKMNDIVMCTSSGSSKLVGKSARLKNDWNGSFGAFCAGIRPNPQYVSPSFIFHFLQSPVFRRWTTSSDGVGIKNIRSSDLKAFPIPLPPLAEQKRIATILDQADALRQKRQQALDHLNQLGQSIFYEMFGENLDVSDTFSRLEDHILEAQIGLVRGAKELSPDFMTPYFRMNAIGNDGAFGDKNVKRANVTNENIAKYKLLKHDLLFNTRNSRELVGKTAVLYENMDGVYNNNILRIRFKRPLLSYYVDHYFRSQRGKYELSLRTSGTTNVFAIYQKSLFGVPIPKIADSGLSQFEKALEKIQKQKNELSRHLHNSTVLFNSLQQRAFRGEL